MTQSDKEALLAKFLYYEEKNPDLKIYCGDCLEIMPLLPKVDLVVTDPPYGIGESNEKNLSRGTLAEPKDYGHYDWDKLPASDEIIQLCRQVSKNQIIFGGNFFNLPPSSCWLVWDKDNGESDFADCELAWTNFTTAVRIKRYKWMGMLQEHMGKHKEFRQHPTQKPLGVIKWAIQQCKYLDTPLSILDPFMGSGTTLVACKEMKKNCIGIDINEKYCEIAKKRLINTQRMML